MFHARRQDDVVVIRCEGEISREELSQLAAVARRARAEGSLVVVDLKRVTHLHYAGAALLRAIPGLRASGASRYVRDLVFAGGMAGHVELFCDVEEAVRAA
jgi:ABC-type transporter Mla MlaB component